MYDEPKQREESDRPPNPSTFWDAVKRFWDLLLGRSPRQRYVPYEAEYPTGPGDTPNDSTPATKPTRREVVFSQESWDVIQQLSRDGQKSLSKVLADALAFERWYWDTRDKGHRVLVERGRKFYEVRRPRRGDEVS